MKYHIPSARDKQLKYPKFQPYYQQRKKPNHTEKTIQQLKKSLGSIQKMIKKSQDILRRTRCLQPRQIKSDSLQLKLTNNSKKKQDKKYLFYNHPKLSKQSKTSLFTKLNTTLHTQKNYSSKQSIINTKIPQKTQTVRPHLFIDAQNMNKGNKQLSHQHMFINQSAVSPISGISHNKQIGIESSFISNLSSPLHYFQKKNKLQNLNDSADKSYIVESLQKQKQSRIDNKSSYYTNPDLKKDSSLKKSILDYKIKTHNTPYLSQKYKSSTPKRRCIFEKQYKNKNTTKYHSNKNENNQLYIKQNENKFIQLNKQNQFVNLDDFCLRVKQFGFIQKYLSHTQIICIFQFLKKSSIPQHKWPLYAVDKIYQKMNNTHKWKT